MVLKIWFNQKNKFTFNSNLTEFQFCIMAAELYELLNVPKTRTEL